MRQSLFLSLFLSISISYSLSLNAQFRGSNLLEVQLGKLPDETADPFPSLYDRTILNYQYGPFRASTTIEQYYTQYNDRNYTALSQASLQFNNKHWDIKLGNFYETLGRGTLLRSFEINGAILEDLGFRSRSYFHRDILGAAAKYRTKKLSIQAMRGNVLNNLIPPTFSREDRRTDTFNSLSADYKFFKKHTVGIVLFNFTKDRDDRNFASTSFNGPLPGNLNYYVEYSQGITESDQFAIYATINGFWGRLSYSLEYKNYQNIILGSGINEPPQALKQQTYRTLNRSTHVSNPLAEDGYQVDLFYSFSNGSVLNFNHALARNRFGRNDFIFRQFFTEWSSQIGKVVEYKAFLDYSIDPLKGEDNRISAGLYTDIKLNQKLRLLPEIEHQLFSRANNDVRNAYYSIGLNYDSQINLSIQLETTTDPFLVNDNQSKRYYPGINMRFKLNQKNTILVFGGERRGGPACSAGVCYEILDFKGIECRWTARF